MNSKISAHSYYIMLLAPAAASHHQYVHELIDSSLHLSVHSSITARIAPHF